MSVGDTRRGDQTAAAGELGRDAAGEQCWAVESVVSVAEVDDLAVAGGDDSA